MARGTGRIAAGSGTFEAGATFPRIAGEPAGATTPEELLAAAHATCFGIGLRSVLARRGGTATRVRVTATVTAEKGGGRIRVDASHLEGVVEGLAGVEPAALDEIARAAEEACTISTVIRPTVQVTVRVRSASA